MRQFFRELRKYGAYIRYAAKARLKEDLKGSKLGWLWWLAEPAVSMLIYLFVYRVLFRRDTEYLVAVIFIGVSFWRFFNTTAQGAAATVRRNRRLLSRVHVPKFVFVLSAMGAGGVKLLCALAAVGGLLVFYRVEPSWHMLQLLPVLGVLGLLTFGVSLLIVHAGVYFEDLGNFLRPGFQLLFYASGVFYPIEQTWGEAADWMLWLNPVALVIHDARRALLYGKSLHWAGLCFWALAGTLLVAAGVKLTRRFEKQYIKIL